jgi:hypothetical protein
MFARRHVPPLGVEQLKRAASGIRRMDDAPAAADPGGSHPYTEGSRIEIADQLARIAAGEIVDTELPSRLAVPVAAGVPTSAVTAAGPQPNFAPAQPAPAPAPVPGWPEGTVRGLLIAGMEEACRWYGAMDGTGCAGCEAAGGLCDFHAPKYGKYWEYSDLHDFAVDAVSDASALYAVACSVRAGRADPGDIAAPGSHLDLILSSALAADGGER